MRKAMAAIVFMLGTSASGGIEHTVLHGVSVGSVRVWTGPQAIPGLTKDGLQSVVESQLRDAGIGLLPSASTLLMVNVTLMVADFDPRSRQSPPAEAACFATIQGSLLEDARLVRNGLRVEASSWSRRSDVAVHVNNCADHVTQQARWVVADFVETFRAMNPSASTTR